MPAYHIAHFHNGIDFTAHDSVNLTDDNSVDLSPNLAVDADKPARFLRHDKNDLSKNYYRIVSMLMLPVLVMTLVSENVAFAAEEKKEETQGKEAETETGFRPCLLVFPAAGLYRKQRRIHFSERYHIAHFHNGEETQGEEAETETGVDGAAAVENALLQAEGEMAAVSAEGKEVINVRTAEELLAVAEKCDTDVWSADKLIELQEDISLPVLSFSPTIPPVSDFPSTRPEKVHSRIQPPLIPQKPPVHFSSFSVLTQPDIVRFWTMPVGAI